jgi:hypothetical protein
MEWFLIQSRLRFVFKRYMVRHKTPTVAEANKKCWRLDTRCIHFHSKVPYKYGWNSYLIFLGIYIEKYLLLNGLPDEAPPLPSPLGVHRWILLSRCKSQFGNVRASQATRVYNETAFQNGVRSRTRSIAFYITFSCVFCCSLFPLNTVKQRVFLVYTLICNIYTDRVIKLIVVLLIN